MKTSTVLGVIVVCIAGIGAWYWINHNKTPLTPAIDYKNATYSIEGRLVTLVNGRAQEPAAPGSSSMVVTQYFGNDATGDLNGDGTPDVAFLLTQSTGGSGTFYYVVAAIKTTNGYQGTSATLIGDRIAPQTTEIGGGKVTVNYADRKPSEPMTAQPSIGKSLVLKLDPATMQFGEVVQGFEGEANPAQMSLDMKTWQWVKTTYNDGTTIVPKKPEKFSLTFKRDGTFSATTDCNGVGGEYSAQNSQISFARMMSTMMYCAGSQESDFSKGLEGAQSFQFTSKGELVFSLKFDSGSMIFK